MSAAPSLTLPLRILTDYTLDGARAREGSGAVPIDLHERSRALFLANSEQVDDELRLEASRLMLYSYKFELEAVSDQPLHSLFPPPHLS